MSLISTIRTLTSIDLMYRGMIVVQTSQYGRKETGYCQKPQSGRIPDRRKDITYKLSPRRC